MNLACLRVGGEGGSLSVTRQPWCYVIMHFSSAAINASSFYSVQHCRQPLDIKALTVVFVARRSLDAIYSFLNVIYLVPI